MQSQIMILPVGGTTKPRAHLLWEQPLRTPTAPGKISLDLSGYLMVSVVFGLKTNRSANADQNVNEAITVHAFIGELVGGRCTTVTNADAIRAFEVAEDGITFWPGAYYESYNYVESDLMMYPYKIYGIK